MTPTFVEEPVLLVEGEGANQRLRVVRVRGVTHTIIEQARHASGIIEPKTWRCVNGERTIGGHFRIFREVLPPPPPEEPENPKYDELNVKFQ